MGQLSYVIENLATVHVMSWYCPSNCTLNRLINKGYSQNGDKPKRRQVKRRLDSD